MASPLALEKMMVGSIIVFACFALVGPVVTGLQRRYRMKSVWAWVISILAFLAVTLLLGYFRIPDRLAPFIEPYMVVFQFIGFVLITLTGTICLFTLCGGKGSDIAKLFKRR